MNYVNATMNTIEQIDVIWLKGESIVRAFEVEHTTAIYSGILRMADLSAKLPNLNIGLHIVAPVERRKQVLHEMRRPAFLHLQCSYLSYDAVDKIAQLSHLQHVRDSILADYEDKGEP